MNCLLNIVAANNVSATARRRLTERLVRLIVSQAPRDERIAPRKLNVACKRLSRRKSDSLSAQACLRIPRQQKLELPTALASSLIMLMPVLTTTIRASTDSRRVNFEIG